MATFIDRDEGLYKKVEDILNQLTPHKFQMVGARITNLNINTKESLEGVVDLIFEKAVDEPSSPIAYANLCKCLALMKVPVGNTENKYVPFRKVLLNKCQKEFESSIVDEVGNTQRSKDIESSETEEKTADLDHDYLDVESKAKRRYLGNVRFIGELFKLNMLTANIIHTCLKQLLIQEDEHSLECLCCLLTIVGRYLDAGRSHVCDEPVDDTVDGYFKQMREVANKAETTSKVRFMLQNVMELRLNNWVPLRDEDAPTTGDKFYRRLTREAVRKEHHWQLPAAFRRNVVYEDSLREDRWNALGSTTTLGPAAARGPKLRPFKRTQKVGELWKSSGVTNRKSSQNQQEFIMENRLEFMVNTLAQAVEMQLSLEKIKTETKISLKGENEDNVYLFDWIHANVGEARCQEPAFVRALTTAICQSSIDETTMKIDEKILRNRSKVLLKYLDHKEELELQALFALQALMRHLEHPKGVLYQMFNLLFDEDVISEEAFFVWEKNDDPGENEGKGIALNSVRTFLTWLKEMDKESEEEN